ncbi:MAG: 4-hydroxy-tetrahydrodipicolinate reductase [Ignavibacteriae bacterium]|nr:4-hydroxy-tetrahydrodipicolinate reductase [Ignavibacteriota bacterium]
MNVALIGYGKMGKEIERLAKERNMNIVAKLNSQSTAISDDQLASIDVAVHFATPPTVLKHIEEWAAKKKHLVVGTTGWHNELEHVRKIVEHHKIGLVYASNFSIGVNIFRHVLQHAGKAFNKFAEYDVSIDETHHTQKLDSPSGTALTLARTLLDTVKRKTEIISTPPERKIEPHHLHIASKRIGTVVGTHRVVFESDADQIELIHTAKNRTGFALGALLAAEWVLDKKGLFTMDDVLGDILQ